MYDYRAMSIFVTVVELGSMQAAAEQLTMTPSAVTQSIQKLETGLQIKLLNRTTRKLSLTEAGEAFYQHAALMVKHAEEALKSVDVLRSQPTGELHIACASGLMDSLLVNSFKSVLDAHPDFHLKLYFADELVDLEEQRMDIALRAGQGVLKDNMIARHLYDFRLCIVAHRDYLATKSMPQNPEALAQLDWISFSNERYASLVLNNQTEQVTISPDYRISCNSLYASRKLTLNGLGVSIQPDIEVEQSLKSGELVQLFPDWTLPSVPLYLVTLQRIQSEKVRIACEMIVDYFSRQK